MGKTHWMELQMAGIPYEDWDVLDQSDYQEYMQLNAEERYDRDHGIYDDDKEDDDDEY